MKEFISLIRPNVAVLAALGVLIGALVGGVADYTQIGIGVLVVFLITGGGNGLNDYFDYDIDKVNKPDRPIPSEKVRRRDALLFSNLLLLTGIMLVIVFLKGLTLHLAIFNTFVLYLYNGWLKRTVFGHFVDSWLAASVFLFGALIGGLPIGGVVWVLFVISFLNNLGREVAKGLEDFYGDSKAGAKTLEIIVGRKAGRMFSAVLVLVSIFVSPIPYLLGFMGLPYLIVVALADLVFFFAIIKVFSDPGAAQKIMKLGMFLGMLAFLVGVLL